MDFIDEIKAAVLRAHSDPGSVLPRGECYSEPLHQWQARAMEQLLQSFRFRLAALEATRVDLLEHQPKSDL